jgi:tight adherence protein B
MKNINIVITLLTLCLAVVLLILSYVVFGGRLRDGIKRAAEMKVRDSGSPDRIAGTPVDYDIYLMTVKEKLICILPAGAVIFAAGYIFYRSIVLSLLLLPLALKYPRLRTEYIIKKRKNELNLQFREALYSVSSSLSAGKSIEASFRDALRELSLQYPDAETYILKELELINKRISMNETIEAALADFAARSHLEDIINFTDVFSICKRTGGNLVQVMKNTAEIISEKIDVKQEINILLTEKKLEHKVLNLMPVLIVLLLSTSSEEFMAPVFTEPLGRVAMTVSLILFMVAFLISGKIMDIEV